MKLPLRLLGALSGVLFAALALRAEGIDIPNLMADAKVGDWVLYEMPGGIGMRHEVTAVTAAELTLTITTMMNGQALSTMTQKLPRTQGELTPAAPKDAPPDVKPVITKGTVTVKGQALESWTIEMTVQGRKSRTVLAKGVPINGMVSSELDGQVMLKLVDFGRK